MKPLFVSYATFTYATEIDGWCNSLDKFGLAYVVESRKCRGRWRLNCAYKPEVIKTFMDEFDCPIVFVDIDARLQRWPAELMDASDRYDFAGHFQHIRGLRKEMMPMPGTAPISTACLFFNNSRNGRTLLNRWNTAEVGQGLYGQVVFSRLWYAEFKKTIRTLRLSQNYVRVDPSKQNWYDKGQDNPVFVHSAKRIDLRPTPNDEHAIRWSMGRRARF